jgi:uncharacterized heparinase superfamily protein
MRRPSRLGLYFHTLRYLKPVQLYSRIWFRLRRYRPNLAAPPPLRRLNRAPVDWHCRPACMLGQDRFRFLNETGDLTEGWDPPSKSRLWRYNLHYFDDLSAQDAAARQSWHRGLVSRWIAENPLAVGSGWDPYPLSLRIVNWIKWSLTGKNKMEPGWHHSMAVQTRFLTGRLEHHLLGNHLFANAKALVFAGLYFHGSEAEKWLAKGLTILEREVPCQILDDGGHFERSPMYHAIILEDLLDLINLLPAYGRQAPAGWQDVAGRMLTWLETLTHPDGRMALFNDAALGIAADAQALRGYAARLGMNCGATPPGPLAWLPKSGYVRCQLGEAVVLLDVAAIGPDYQPAHAHADTLGFELSLRGQRVIVDSGVSTYEKNAERQRQRGTAAHNTVIVDGKDSSQVWGGFRVARRARPFGLDIDTSDAEIRVACSHDGYRHLPGKPVHRRQWVLNSRQLRIRDRVAGRCKTAEARYHFHPDAYIALSGDATGLVRLPNGRQIPFWFKGGAGRVEESTYHPEFNRILKNRCLAVVFNGTETEIGFDFKHDERL